MSISSIRTEGLYTYADYLTWPEEERWELIDGVPFDMTPAPSTKHQEILGELYRLFSQYLHGKLCKVYFSPFDVRLPKGDEKDEGIPTVVQPDLTIICDRSKIDEQGCKGAPDLIIEVLSPSTTKKDLGVKLRLFERVGVSEYWVVHPNDQTILVFTLKEGTYATPTIYKAPDEVPVQLFPGFSIFLSEVFS